MLFLEAYALSMPTGDMAGALVYFLKLTTTWSIPKLDEFLAGLDMRTLGI